ncbi:hypothetical protein [Nocardia wallacei]|uniref:hypothetical protein n=1 Tax=Nocardia wallacei TaxID=480035 RepID=UPI00245620C9|nr:hypothetical protein [Nocardia wallacei]
MSSVPPACHYRRGNNLNSCDTAIASFTPDKWLASTGHAGHLFDGLTYLLQAAQEWQLQKELELELSGYQVQTYAMDSAFIRARSLFEFFVGESKRTYCHARCLFGLNGQLTYPKYLDRNANPGANTGWEDVLHVGSIHLKNRDNPVKVVGHDGTLKDLNQMPVDFAKGILDVWSDFERALQALGHTQLHNMAEACKDQAKKDAGQVFDSIVQRADKYTHASIGRLKPLF